MDFSSFSAFAPKSAPSPRRCGLVFLASALGACASVYYSHTPGIPFDTTCALATLQVTEKLLEQNIVAHYLVLNLNHRLRQGL